MRTHADLCRSDIEACFFWERGGLAALPRRSLLCFFFFLFGTVAGVVGDPVRSHASPLRHRAGLSTNCTDLLILHAIPNKKIIREADLLGLNPRCGEVAVVTAAANEKKGWSPQRDLGLDDHD